MSLPRMPTLRVLRIREAVNKCCRKRRRLPLGLALLGRPFCSAHCLGPRRPISVPPLELRLPPQSLGGGSPGVERGIPTSPHPSRQVGSPDSLV